MTYTPQLGGALKDHDALMTYSPKLGGDLIDALLLSSDFLGLNNRTPLTEDESQLGNVGEVDTANGAIMRPLNASQISCRPAIRVERRPRCLRSAPRLVSPASRIPVLTGVNGISGSGLTGFHGPAEFRTVYAFERCILQDGIDDFRRWS